LMKCSNLLLTFIEFSFFTSFFSPSIITDNVDFWMNFFFSLHLDQLDQSSKPCREVVKLRVSRSYPELVFSEGETHIFKPFLSRNAI
jgi:hypothetical protein